MEKLKAPLFRGPEWAEVQMTGALRCRFGDNRANLKGNYHSAGDVPGL